MKKSDWYYLVKGTGFDQKSPKDKKALFTVLLGLKERLTKKK